MLDSAIAVNEAILATLRAHDAAAADWLEHGLTTALEHEPGEDTFTAIRIHFARIARKFSSRPSAPEGSSRPSAPEGGTTLLSGPDGTPVRAGDLGRLWLLDRVLAPLPPHDGLALVSQLLQRGEAGEQASVLRALPYLPHPDRFLALAIDACRTNSIDVFSAIACENPYPAAHFPAPAFAQMVLKAIFLAVPVARIVGLRGRVTPELVRMVEDYGQERRAAGRPVPADVETIARMLETPS